MLRLPIAEVILALTDLTEWLIVFVFGNIWFDFRGGA